MQAIANWLLARPYNAVLGLAIALLLPGSQTTSGAIIVLLVLARGFRPVLRNAVLVAAILAVTTLILGGTASSVAVMVAGNFVPAFLLAKLLMVTRSLTLSMQVSLIVAIAVMLVFQLAVPNEAAFWQPYLDRMVAVFSELGVQMDTTPLTANVITLSVILSNLLLFCAGMLIGYWWYRQQPGETANFGRFRDMTYGRVIAFTMGLAFLLAFATNATWLQNIAFIMFVMFMMQGLAIVHWLHTAEILPGFAVVSVYVLLPILHVVPVTMLALLGYTDAWIEFRRRMTKA